MTELKIGDYVYLKRSTISLKDVYGKILKVNNDHLRIRWRTEYARLEWRWPRDLEKVTDIHMITMLKLGEL